MLMASVVWVFLTKTAKGQFVRRLTPVPACAQPRMPTAANWESEPIRSQQLWSECSRLLANCIMGVVLQCLHPIGIARARRAPDCQRTDAIKRANPASWKHVNLYGAYSFLDIGDGGRPPGIDQSLGGSPR
jgi:Tn3 transposase DDE domain